MTIAPEAASNDALLEERRNDSIAIYTNAAYMSVGKAATTYTLRTLTERGEAEVTFATVFALTSGEFVLHAKAVLNNRFGSGWVVARVIGENGWKLGEVSRN